MDKNFDTLNKLLGAFDTNAMSARDISASFEMLVRYMEKTRSFNQAELENLRTLFTEAVQELKDGNKADMADFAKQVKALVNPIVSEHKARMQEITDKLATVKDGEPGADADEEMIFARLVEQIPQPETLTPGDIRDQLESLTDGERLDKSAVRGIDQIEEEIQQLRLRPTGGKGGAKGFMLFVGGKKKAFTAQSLNLVAGSNVTLAYSNAQGRNDVTITASGGGLTLLAATGTINSVNVAFTFTSKPTYIVSDGAWYRENKGWSWNSGSLTATLTIPPNYDIWGF